MKNELIFRKKISTAEEIGVGAIYFYALALVFGSTYGIYYALFGIFMGKVEIFRGVIIIALCILAIYGSIGIHELMEKVKKAKEAELDKIMDKISKSR